MASFQSLLGLDLLNFFTANVQTGFGPFIAEYLTIHKWTQGQIGLALTVGTLTAMLSGLPAGALLDRTVHRRSAAILAILSISACALIIGLWPAPLPVMLAEILHGFSSCVMTPAIAAISLALVGQRAIGARFGRNASWAAFGNGGAALLMGLCGRYLSVEAVFWLTAVLGLPASAALLLIRRDDLRARVNHDVTHARLRDSLRVFVDRRMLIFGICALLFQISDGAMLPLAAGQVTAQAGGSAPLIIAFAIVVPQLVVALLSPLVGRAAQGWGRRAVLLAGFSALPVRAALLAFLPAPILLVPLQLLSGISGAVFGVLLPLIAADVTEGENFNLGLAALGLASGVGGTISTLAGLLVDAHGLRATFLFLAGIGLLACLTVWALMPETRPADTLSRHHPPSPAA